MVVLPFVPQQHKFTVISTTMLLIAGLPLLFFTVLGYVAYVSIVLARGSMLYVATTYGLAKNHKRRVIRATA